MELVQFLRLTGTLLLLGSFVQAFSNSFSGAKQCELVNLKWWTSPTGARATPPFQFLIIPIGGSAIPGMIIDIPDNAETWNKTSGEGSYQLPPIQLSAGSRFLAAMGDGYGFGGVSQILAIDGSDDSSCLLNTQHSESSKLFHFPAAPRQCEDFTITWDPSIAVNGRIFIRGYVPSGTAFALDPPPIGASQTFWTVNIPIDTEFVLLFSTGGSEGLDTPLETSPVFKGRTSEGRQMNEAASTSNLYTTYTVDSSAPGGEVAPTPVTPAENVPEIINRHTDAGPVIMTDNNISPYSPRIIDLPPRYEDAAPPTPSLDLTSPQPSQQPSLRR
ncbi:hypothetical protein FRC02_002244 [Tulasnella sp. 418]|nr:hypothetical protein FRC02_002244 [Tulasnella sp. 418]